MQTTSLNEIKSFINSIKKNCSKHNNFHTNYYFGNLKNTEFKYIINEKNDSLIFLTPAEGFYRLYFATNNLNNLAILKTKLPNNIEGVLDVVFRKQLCEELSLFLENNFTFHAEFWRLRTSKIQNQNTKVEFANIEDTDEIQNSLRSTFDEFDSHFPTRDELMSYIKEKNIIINRTHEGIKGYVIFQVSGSTAHFNYFFNNDNNRLSMPKLYDGCFTELFNRKIKHVFLWVNEKNIKIKDYYQKRGFKPDGTIDKIYKF